MKNLFLLILCITFLAGCSSYNDAMRADSRIRKVELGMNKMQVIGIMGKSYHRMEVYKGVDGADIEVLGYPTVDAIYMLSFENNILKEFRKDIIVSTDKVLIESTDK